MIGPYRVEFPIKQSRYAQTYRVSKGEELFCLKLIDNNAVPATAQKQSLPPEVQILRTLSHPNIVSYRDCFRIDKGESTYTALVTRFISGETLADRISRMPYINVAEAKRIVEGVLKGVAYMHSLESPVFHDGLTLQNVMLDMSDPARRPVIIGFSHAVAPKAGICAFSREGMNPFYLAPEVFAGSYSERTDVFSVGAMLYHILFGLPPYFVDLSVDKLDDKQMVAAIAKQQEKPLRIPAREDAPFIEPRIQDIVSKALAPDPHKRYQSAQEFLNDLLGQTEDVNSDATIKVTPVEERILRGNGFKDVAGLDDLKERMQNEVINLVRYPDKYRKLKVRIPNGFLLYGPPGCGKTFLGEKLAEELGWNYVYVHCSDVASPYIHGGQEKIAALFERARKNAPTVIFLDEIDALIADRKRQTNVSEYGEVNEFLTQLNNCSESRVLVVAATNNPQGIDPAALRSGRLEIKLFVPAPDLKEREQLFRLALNGRADVDIDYSKLALKTRNYVCKDVDQLVNRAALAAANRDLDKIPMRLLEEAINKYRGDFPSVSLSELRRYDLIRAQFEENASPRPHIGF